jgi:putative SOS response-associated peptidase YedK
MPVVLAREDEYAWLDPQLTAASQVLEILSSSAGVPLDTCPVFWIGHASIRNTVTYPQLTSRGRDEGARKVFASPYVV